MGALLARVAVRGVAKAIARGAVKTVTKQAVKRIALRGAKELGKGAAVAAAGAGVDVAINKMRGNGKRRRKTGHRKLCGGRRYRKKRSI